MKFEFNNDEFSIVNQIDQNAFQLDPDILKMDTTYKKSKNGAEVESILYSSNLKS